MIILWCTNISTHIDISYMFDIQEMMVANTPQEDIMVW